MRLVVQLVRQLVDSLEPLKDVRKVVRLVRQLVGWME